MDSAVIVGISKYRAPTRELPGVAADVREIGKLLGSGQGNFAKSRVRVLTERRAGRTEVLNQLGSAFEGAGEKDTVFAYLAGHGGMTGDRYYYLAYDTDPTDLPGTAVPLATIKRLFDRCRSRRLILWLDFCHSGGIIPRGAAAAPAGAAVGGDAIARTLSVVKGRGRVIVAACTPEQYAFEGEGGSAHGAFTGSLLDGLRGAAAHEGEVTANSLFDYIDRKMGSDRQRPMQFGQMEGRVVLAHHGDAGREPGAATARPSKPPAPPRRPGQRGTVNSSGDLCMLGGRYFETSSVRHAADGSLTVEIHSESGETDAALRALRPSAAGWSWSAPTQFAHRNDGFLARVAGVESRSEGNRQTWSVSLKPEPDRHGGLPGEMAYSVGGRQYSPDDIARVRAGRLLLNDPPAPPAGQRSMFRGTAGGLDESFIAGSGGGHEPVDGCVVRVALGAGGKDASVDDLRRARLAAVYKLRATGVCEHVIELALGPVSGGSCHVRFRGRRRAVYTNQSPAEIELEGDCPLT